MDAWDVLRRVAADQRSGASEIAARAAVALAQLDGRTEVMRAARRLLGAHPAMAQLWRTLAVAWSGGDVESFGQKIKAETGAVAKAAAGWGLSRRTVVLTHSASSTVLATLQAGRSRVSRIMCTASLPGGEGRLFAQRLRRAGFDASVIADAEIARACGEASVALVGADALTPDAVVNKVGTRLLALAAREEGVPCYALAGSTKMLPSAPPSPSAYEETPLRLFAAVITERGPLSPAAVRRAAARVVIPRALLALAP